MKDRRARNRLAFRWYDPKRKVLGKTMAEHLRFAVCYWHTLCWPGLDPFGGETFLRPWHQPGDAMDHARTQGRCDVRDVAAARRPVLHLP